MLAGLISGWIAALAIAFSFWTATDSWAFPRFIAVTLVLIVVPGRQILRWAVGEVSSRAEEMVLSLTLGALGASGLYWILLRGQLVELFWIWPLVAAAAALKDRGSLACFVSGLFRRPSPSEVALLAAACTACLPLIVVPLYYRNLSLDSSGGLAFYPFPDVVLHLAAAQELTHSVPPQVPFVPGQPLRYHYGMDLLAALYARLGGLDVADVCTRFLPTLYAGLLLLSAFCLGRRWLGWGIGGALVGFLVLLGEDFSFVPGLIVGATEPWSSHFFGWPSVISNYLMNPLLPALGFSFSALLCIQRWELRPALARRWLLLGGALLAGVGAHKAFLLVHLLLGFAVAGGLLWARGRGGRLLGAATVLALVSLPVGLALVGAGRSSAAVELQHWPYVAASLIRCGLWDTALGRSVERFLSGSGGMFDAVVYGFVVVPSYLIGAYGLRVIGIRRLYDALTLRATSSGLSAALGVVVVSGPLLALTLAITPAGYEVRQSYNEAVWFAVQSKHLMWIFAVAEVRSVLRRLVPRRAVAAGAVLLLAVLPSTADYFLVQSRELPLPRLGPQIMDLVRIVGGQARPGDVVLAPGDACRVFVALTPLRSPCFGIHPRYFAAPKRLEDDGASLDRFWQELRGDRIHEETLDRFRVRWLVAGAKSAATRHPRLVQRFAQPGLTVFEVLPHLER